MSVQVKHRRDTATNIAPFIPAQGEIVVDITNNRMIVGDGTTAGGWAAAKLSEISVPTRRAVADAAYVAVTTDRLIAYTSLTAGRVVTLPAASAFPTGVRLTVVDETGSASPLLTISLARGGADTINGATSVAINIAFGYLAVESNGSNAWTVLDQSAPPALATPALAPNGAGVQVGVLETSVSLSGASTNASVQIPANCIVLSVGARVTTAITGATSYEVGISGNLAQFGSGLSLAAGSTNYGLIGPTAFYAATTLIVTAAGSNFTGGVVRLSIHYLVCSPSAS